MPWPLPLLILSLNMARLGQNGFRNLKSDAVWLKAVKLWNVSRARAYNSIACTRPRKSTFGTVSILRPTISPLATRSAIRSSLQKASMEPPPHLASTEAADSHISSPRGRTTAINCARSCHICNAKKIRCDKRRPCSGCTRAGKACSYPTPGPRIRRTKRTIIAEMGARISQLEKALSQENDQESRNATARIAIESSPCRDEETAKSGQTARGVPKDVLVQHDSTSQYFNEVFLSGVIREVRRRPNL